MMPDARMTTEEIMHIQIDADGRVERASWAVRLAETHSSSLVIGAPLRYGVEATRRLRAADAELADALAAYDAAQDADCPDWDD